MNRKETKRKPYVTYDPIIGYRYIPNTEMQLTSPDGRKYTVKINSMGIRSDKEYSVKKPDNIFRVLVFGDSLTAGQYVNNEERFTERLEEMFPDTEFVNFGLEGTGTDQQFLIFREYASVFEYDAVLLCPFVENIRRNTARYRLTVDLKSERWILTPKPRLEQKPDKTWGWTGIPVPRKRPFYDEASPDILKDTDFGGSDMNRKFSDTLKAALSRILEKTNTKGFLYSLIKYEPYGEYRDPSSGAWQNMKTILAEFTKLVNDKKFIVAPLVPYSFLRYNLASTYRVRFSEENPYFFDILPYLKDLSPENCKRCFIPDDCHFSSFGHERVAKALADEFRRRKILER
ncbi:MAG: SGNH/GDSL hydrolase family protein [Candidatus Omnitrophota bacterium]